MPHLIKKFVNALERSSFHKTNLKLRGQPLSLGMIEELWERSRLTPGRIRMTKHSYGHFNKDALNRLRFHLTVQVTTQDSILLTDEFCDENEKVEYAPLRLILDLLDELIDIMNAKPAKKYTALDSPDHK
jgi:hypothetical protein